MGVTNKTDSKTVNATSASQNRQAAIAKAQAAADRSGSLIAQAEKNPALLKDPAFKQKFDAANADVKASQQELNKLKTEQNVGATDSSASSGGGQREVDCPFCNGKVLSKKAGRPFQRITGFLQRAFAIKLPSTIMQYLQEKAPVEKSPPSNRLALNILMPPPVDPFLAK